MTAHDVVWGVIVALIVFGGGLEWFLSRMGEKDQPDQWSDEMTEDEMADAYDRYKTID